MTDRRQLGLVLGPLVFIVILLIPPPAELSDTGWRVVAVAALMAIWWISEAIPIAATSLLPVALFPLLNVMSTKATTSAYANHLVFLFLGGFLIAMAMQKWNLHKRIALHTIRAVGVSPPRIILGFMLATAFLSMWISNTATAMMMLPIALAVVGQLTNDDSSDLEAYSPAFGVALMLGIAYSASIGGVATLIGTPPNAILAGIVERVYEQRISFAAWMSFGLPLSIVMLTIAWFYLTRIAYPVKHQTVPNVTQVIQQQINQLGPMTRQEGLVALIFALVAITWITRGLIEIKLLDGVSDATIAIVGALLLFIIPSDIKQREFLLDWSSAVKLPWDILILFGGGFALAQGFSDSGLTEWIVLQMSVLKGAYLVVLILAITLVVIFLTEVTSNTATATLILPVLGALATAVDVEPMTLMIPAAIAASYAFMLPVATPPNAIVFSSRYITIPQMARAGFYMNLVASLVITLFVLFLLPHINYY
ncbi:MAG: DASS family sodium-coupled anion symporter [Thioalkalispiraceae bacterium]